MTTIVIDVQNCKVYSDSRGTQSDEKFSIKNFGCVTEESYNDTTKKIFKVGNHVITGCGSLDLLTKIVGDCQRGNFHTPENFYVKSKFDFNKTKVYICKKVNGKLSGVKLYLTPKRIPLTNMVKVKIVKEVLDQDCLFYTDGSGYQYASGAVQAKATPKEAVNIAIKFDKYSGGEIQEVSL